MPTHEIPVAFCVVADDRETAARQVVHRLETAISMGSGQPRFGVTGDELVDSYSLPQDWRLFDLEEPGFRIVYAMTVPVADLRPGDVIVNNDEWVQEADEEDEDDDSVVIAWCAGSASGWDPPTEEEYRVLRCEAESGDEREQA